MTMEGYRPRLMDAHISGMMKAFGAVCVEGPKWCGKTWTSLSHADSAFDVGDKSGGFQNRMLASMDPDVALRGAEPRLIDEWQEAPAIWDAVRAEVDSSAAKGRFILSGSSTPRAKGVMHSGAGRIGSVRMRTMSLFESGDSGGQASLRDIFGRGLSMTDCGETGLERLAHLAVRGGWPGSIGLGGDLCGLVPRDYLEKAARDAARLDGRERDSEKMRMLIRSLARNESTLAGKEALKRDMMGSDGERISDNTLSEYLDCLGRMFLTDDQPSFSPNSRSSVRVGKSGKRHLADPSLAVAALEMGAEGLVRDLKTFGFIFEAMCARDLRIYAEASGGRLSHYRDGNGNEIDAVVEMRDGSWGAFEAKLGADGVDEAAENLLRIAKLLERNGARPPSALCVVCGAARYAYRRPDGVHVAPLTSLRD